MNHLNHLSWAGAHPSCHWLRSGEKAGQVDSLIYVSALNLHRAYALRAWRLCGQWGYYDHTYSICCWTTNTVHVAAAAANMGFWCFVGVVTCKTAVIEITAARKWEKTSNELVCTTTAMLPSRSVTACYSLCKVTQHLRLGNGWSFLSFQPLHLM